MIVSNFSVERQGEEVHHPRPCRRDRRIDLDGLAAIDAAG